MQSVTEASPSSLSLPPRLLPTHTGLHQTLTSYTHSLMLLIPDSSLKDKTIHQQPQSLDLLVPRHFLEHSSSWTQRWGQAIGQRHQHESVQALLCARLLRKSFPQTFCGNFVVVGINLKRKTTVHKEVHFLLERK